MPPSLTLEMIKGHHGSVPGNPLLAEPLYLARYIERMGTGIPDMIRWCKKAGLAEPEFTISDGFITIVRRKEVTPQVTEQVTGQVTEQVTEQVTGEVARLVSVLQGNMKRKELQDALGLHHRENFRNLYLLPALAEGYVEMTIPDKPQSKSQKYRLTAKGQALKAQLEKR